MWSGVVNGHGVEHFVQQLQSPVQMHFDPAGSFFYGLAPIVRSPALHKGQPQNAQPAQVVDSDPRSSRQTCGQVRDKKLIAGSGTSRVLTYRRGNSADRRNASRARNVTGDGCCLSLGRDMGSLSLLLHLQMALLQVKNFDVRIREDFVDSVAG